MNAIPQTVATGDLKSNPAAVFRMIEAGPVVVMNRTTPAAVMVSPHAWNETAARLAFYERQAAADRAAAADDWVTGPELDRVFAEIGIEP